MRPVWNLGNENDDDDDEDNESEENESVKNKELCNHRNSLNLYDGGRESVDDDNDSIDEIALLSCINKIHRIESTWQEIERHDLKTSIVSETFYWIAENHSYLLPFWQFARTNVGSIKDDPGKQHLFYAHVVNVSNALAEAIKHHYSIDCLKSIAKQIGKRHFYYNAVEIYIDIFSQGLLQSLLKVCTEKGITLNHADIEAWQLLLCNTFVNTMKDSIKFERWQFIRKALNKSDLLLLNASWTHIASAGITECGMLMCTTALDAYQRCNVDCHTGMMTSAIDGDDDNNGNSSCCIIIDKSDARFSLFAADTIHLLESILVNYNPKNCKQLPELAKDYATRYFVVGVSPYLVINAMKKGLIEMLHQTLHSKIAANPSIERAWMKLFELMVQLIIVSLVDNLSNIDKSNCVTPAPTPT